MKNIYALPVYEKKKKKKKQTNKEEIKRGLTLNSN